MNRSMTDGIPSLRTPFPGLGISILFTGRGLGRMGLINSGGASGENDLASAVETEQLTFHKHTFHKRRRKVSLFNEGCK